MAELKVGDEIKLSESHPRHPGKKGKVVQVFPTGFVKVRLESGEADVELKSNIAANALNAEDAQGHEHGDDGKFISKDGGSSNGGYEDPKTKRMKERLAKMREKNEALRKEIESRKAGLAKKKADTEKMRSEVMKANVEKWKASLKSKNAVVQNALAAKNAAANAKSVYQIESDLERKIGAKIGKEVSVGIEGDALSVDIANESDTDKVLDVVRRELGEIKAYRYVNNGDIPYLAVTLKNGIAANAQIENTRTLSVSKQAWTKSELKGIEVMKKHLASHRGVLPRTTKEVDDVLGMIPDIDTTEKQNVMSYFKYGRGKSLVANSIKADVAKIAKMVGRELTPNEEKSARILLEAGEPASRVARSIQSMAPNADTGVIRKTAVNGAGYVDASTVMIRPGDAVVFKAGYRLHSNDDDWLERNGDTVREVRGDEVKLGPSANDWAKIKDLMVWHNSRSTNAVVVKALNASRVPLDAEKARNAVGRDKRDAAAVESWVDMFEYNFLKFVLPKSTDKAKARKSGEFIIKRVEEALGSEGGRGQLKRMGWTIQKMRDALEKGLNAATARNANENISGIVVNWKRSDAALKVAEAIDLLVGLHNEARNWIDVDADEKNALSTVGRSIADLNKAWKVFLRERA